LLRRAVKSDLMSVSVDYLVKDQDCAVSIKPQSDMDLDELMTFRLDVMFS